MMEMIKMVLVLSLICGLSGLTLATVRQATSEKIEEQVLTYVQGPALDMIFTGYDNNPVKDRKSFDVDGASVTVFPVMKDGRLTGVAFETFGKGYGGPVGIMVGFETDGAKLVGIGTTTLKETHGLGMRLVEPEYRDQFRGHPTDAIELKKNGGHLTAISGATISSTGSVAAVNEAVRIFNQIKDQITATWAS